MIPKDFATPIQSRPEQETVLEAILAGLFSFIVLPVLAYALMVMLTAPDHRESYVDTSDVRVVINGHVCREWSSEMFSNQKVRKVCS